jgi:TonB family protein
MALGLAHKHQISGAIAEYREAVRLDPDDALACNQLGQLLEQEGDLDGAIAAFKEAVGREPDVGFFHYNLADLLEMKGDLDGAIAQAREAIRIGPDNFIWHRDLAKMLRNKGDNEEAAKETQIATALQMKNLPKRIRVGGAVMSAKLIHQVRPTYPGDANVEGTVRLDAVIGKDGTVQDLKLLSGHPILVSAAMEAVSKWRYQPTLLNGVPVEVETEIDLNFKRARN